MVRQWAVVGILALAIAGAARAAEKFEDKTIGVSVEAPAGFVVSPEAPKKDEFLGEGKGLYFAPDVKETAGILMIHHMDIPGGADFATFKAAFADQLKQVFGDGFKVVKQEDVKGDKLAGFMLEFECPGDGEKPTPGGTTPHHVRWYLIRDGDKQLVGVLYAARQSAWKDMEKGFAASAKTLKHAGD